MKPIDINNSWKTPIVKNLEDGTLPTIVVVARKLKSEPPGSSWCRGYNTEEGFRSYTFVASTSSKLNTWWEKSTKGFVEITRGHVPWSINSFEHDTIGRWCRRTQSLTPDIVINVRGLETLFIHHQRYSPQWRPPGPSPNGDWILWDLSRLDGNRWNSWW